ncbi:pimeloyl-ACP methyl ester carboxylesterase [Herbihabitans rhizosphaerae]|uniref:Pimeloyl-ACP methyl ester carboxylesterase n=1 Tax=Herbihabitans rhizosphaerae TaxID=1872711 RepID=A0A4Q7L4U9_9PSEU|nr:alpha/beta fold hydrolase [Herbihabitans rhizosphaerae]RZS44236.1 pimeloyl-ACP methyl ester carboxylesterase [Herbihabitans rhizosphaerae]
MYSVLSPHAATRVELPGRYGAIAALRAEPAGDAIALLVPGYTGSKEDFAPMIDPIAAAGIGVLAIDLPGQHESPGPDDEQAYSPTALGLVVSELAGKLAAEGATVLLLGHSFGGLVARGAMLAGAPVAGLTLMDTGPGELPPGPRRQVVEAGRQIMASGGIVAAQQVRELLDAKAPNWADKTPRVREFLRTRFLASSPQGLLGMGDGLRTEPDRVPELAAVLRRTAAPCLVVCGESDDAWPVAAQRDMAERLEADFAVVPGAAHSPNIENPERLLDTLLPTWQAWLA